MKIIRDIFAVHLLIILVGCASVKNTFPLPDQALDASSSEPKTRVVFYNGNGLNPLFLDGSWRVGIKVNGEGVENLHIGKYVQLFLSPGTYNLELSHIDLFTFRDNYDFTVGENPIYVQVYNTPVSTKYKVSGKEPEGFRNKFQPANEFNKNKQKNKTK